MSNLNLGLLEFTPSYKTERELQIISFCSETLTRLNTFRQNYEKEWKVAEDRVFVRPRANKGEDASDSWTHVMLPHEFSVIRRKIADFVNNFPEAVFSSTNPDEQWKLEAWKKVFQFQLEESNFLTQLVYSFLDVFIKGVGFLEIGYLEKYKDIKENEFKKDEFGSSIFSPANIVGTTSKKILEYDGLFVKRVDPLNVWIDENCVDLHGVVNNAKICIIKDIYDIETFRLNFSEFKHVNAVIPVSRANSLLNEFSQNNKNEHEVEQDATNDSRYVHLYRAYRPESDECYYIANNEVIYDGSIPYGHKKIPMSMFKNLPYPGNLYVPGEVSLMQQIAEVKNVCINLAIDNNRLANQPHTYIAGEIDPNTIDRRVGGISYMPRGFNVRDQIQVDQYPDFTQGTLQIGSLMDDYFIQATGVDMRAMFPPPSEKVTQTIMKKELSNIILGLTVKFNEINGLKNAFELMTQVLMEFYPKKKVRHFLDPEGQYQEMIAYPQIQIKDFKVNITKKLDSQGKVVGEILGFQKEKGIVSFFEGKPEFIRQQLIINVKEGSMTTSFKELALKKWLELTQLMGTNPEAIQRIDWQKWLSTTLAKFEENPEDIMKDDFMDMLKSKITEPEKELRSILLQKPYSPTVPIDHESHAKLLQIFMMSDEYKEGTKNILTGKIKPLPQFIKKKIFDRWLEHTEKEFLGEPQQPQQPPPPAPPSPSPLAKKQDMMNNKPDQILPDIESQARSMGGQISQPI